ncbi:hypothetical protein PENTCL1PPCAC_7269, partial [Pristionchus entomophagus]
QPPNLKMTGHKAVLKIVDMSEKMQQDAIKCRCHVLEKCKKMEDVTAYIKKEFDKKYHPTWHCIVARNFGYYVTHETNHFIYFSLGEFYVLLFKCG